MPETCLPHLHVLHPVEATLPGVRSWLDGALRAIREAGELTVVEREYDGYWFNAQQEHARINQNPGPVLVLQPDSSLAVLNTASSGGLRERLESSAHNFMLVGVGSESELADAIELVRRPVVPPAERAMPVRMIVALKILDKLGKNHKWGGDNNSWHLPRSDLPKGGFKDGEQLFVLDVEEVLRNAGLICAKRGDGQLKVWLNKEHRSEICAAVVEKRFASRELQRKLTKHGDERTPEWPSGFGEWAQE